MSTRLCAFPAKLLGFLSSFFQFPGHVVEVPLYGLHIGYFFPLGEGSERRLDVLLDLGSEDVMCHGGSLGGLDNLVPLWLERP